MGNKNHEPTAEDEKESESSLREKLAARRESLADYAIEICEIQDSVAHTLRHLPKFGREDIGKHLCLALGNLAAAQMFAALSSDEV